MSHHPSAQIFWGYDLGNIKEKDDCPNWLDAEVEWKEVLFRNAGFTSDEELEEYPVQMSCYGNAFYSSDLWCVQLKESIWENDMYCDPINLNMLYASFLNLQPFHVHQINEFMKIMELPIPDKDPGWHIALSYG